MVEADWYGWLKAQGIMGNYSHSWRNSYKSRPGCISKFPRSESALPWKVIEIIPLIQFVMLMMHLDRMTVITRHHTWIQRLLSGLFPKSTQLAHSEVSRLCLHSFYKSNMLNNIYIFKTELERESKSSQTSSIQSKISSLDLLNEAIIVKKTVFTPTPASEESI